MNSVTVYELPGDRRRLHGNSETVTEFAGVAA